MLGGFQKSREVFLPALGGPFILLLSYYISSLFFIILPSDCNQIIEKGVPQENHTWDKSLLCFNVVTIDKYSHTLISNKVGYMKAYAFSSGSISMLTNPSYWSYVVKLQMNRLKAIYNLFCKKRIGFLLFIVVPCFIVFAIVEITLSVVFYGFPVINWMYIVMRGYTKTLVEMFRTQKVLSKVGHFTLLKLIFSFLIGIVFAYFVFSVCSIFIDSFVFLSEVLIFSFLAVLVYPSFSFGYLFFGIVLIYYVFKMIAGFGKDYAEFLADIVDACKELDNDPFGVQMVGDTIMVSDNRFNNVKKLQCNDMTIELTTQQRNAIRCSTKRKATWLHYKNHAVGVSKALFMKLVDVHRPIHIKIAQGILKLGLIVILILFTASVLRQKPHTVIKGVSEVMHVVFVLVIGALPKILEIAIEHADHSVQKEILLRKLKVDIIRYIDSDAELVNVEH
ncbi:uncharacterized protein LOC127862767 isoform X1 [Dreissena polymorpha]|nr:uncharacterized protein LOC127862767 isoform X1 [Dreissena polymorpha]